MEIKTVAYPKVNLHLAVGEKRSDGYHELASVFQLVHDAKYNDKLTVVINEALESYIDIKGLESVADSKNNTIYKAVDSFLKKADIKASVYIKVEKAIPSQAGLGGGSADAGAVILALNKYHHLDKKDLMDIALSVGSDVPFFVENCEAAVVTGRGEHVYPIESKNLYITLFPNENEKMSTAKAYAMLDKRQSIARLQTVEELRAMYEKPVSEWKFYNDFELVNAKDENPEHKLTGSGTCRYMIDLLKA